MSYGTAPVNLLNCPCSICRLDAGVRARPDAACFPTRHANGRQDYRSQPAESELRFRAPTRARRNLVVGEIRCKARVYVSRSLIHQRWTLRPMIYPLLSPGRGFSSWSSGAARATSAHTSICSARATETNLLPDQKVLCALTIHEAPGRNAQEAFLYQQATAPVFCGDSAFTHGWSHRH